MFDELKEKLKTSSIGLAMMNTREDSPYHREENVWKHTMMTIDWYDENLAKNRNTEMQNIVRIALLFHDTGKPIVEQIKENAERGVYRSYAGHEQKSARVWVDFAMKNGIKDQNFINGIALLIEYHLVYGLKNQKKMEAIKKTIIHYFGENGIQCWKDMMISDQHGRISDNAAEKIATSEKWIKENI